MKRTLATLLALCLLLTCVSIPAMADDGWLTLRVEVFDRSTTGLNMEDNMQLDYIQKNFGDPNHINVDFVPVSRWSETEILNTLLGGGTAPDICMTYDGALVQQFIDMGGLYPMDDLLAEYGQNLTAFLGENVLQFGRNNHYDADGNPILDENGNIEFTQWYAPARRISVARVGAFVRADWLEKLNMEAPTTVEEWVDYLYKAKENNLGGQETIPYIIKTVPEDPLFSVDILVDAMLDFSQITEEMWFSQYKEQLPGAKEAYRLLNKMYNDGIIQETFAIDNGDIRDRNMNQGYSGFYAEGPTQVYGNGSGYQYELGLNVEGGRWIPVQCFKNKNGHYLREVYDANGMCVFIPGWVSEETAIAAMKFLDWMSVLENRYYLQHGIEGINYQYKDENGLPRNKVGADALADEYKMSGDVVFISNGASFDNPELDSAYQSLNYPGFEEEVKQSYIYCATDTYAPATYTITIQSEADYGLMVKAKLSELIANAVTCKPEEFDAVYDRCIQGVLDVGGAEIVAEKLEAYKAGEYRGQFPKTLYGE